MNTNRVRVSEVHISHPESGGGNVVEIEITLSDERVLCGRGFDRTEAYENLQRVFATRYGYGVAIPGV